MRVLRLWYNETAEQIIHALNIASFMTTMRCRRELISRTKWTMSRRADALSYSFMICAWVSGKSIIGCNVVGGCDKGEVEDFWSRASVDFHSNYAWMTQPAIKSRCKVFLITRADCDWITKWKSSRTSWTLSRLLARLWVLEIVQQKVLTRRNPPNFLPKPKLNLKTLPTTLHLHWSSPSCHQLDPHHCVTFRRVLDFIPLSSSANYRFRELQDSASLHLLGYLPSFLFKFLMFCAVRMNFPATLAQNGATLVGGGMENNKIFFFSRFFLYFVSRLRLDERCKKRRLMNLSGSFCIFSRRARLVCANFFAHF